MKKILIFLCLILPDGILVSVKAEPINLTSEIPSAFQTIIIQREGEGELTIKASAPGTDWGEKNAESAVLTLYLDDAYSQDIVLFKGADSFDYSVGLGNLSAGEHQLKFSFSKEKSSKKAHQVLIDTYTITIHTPDEEDYAVWQYSPIFYGRNENYHSDVPLLMWPTRWRDEENFTHMQYSVIWSNEDGGTDTPALMARWGRTTDIEWIYEVVLNKSGEIQEEKYHARRHKHKDFSGEKSGYHPILVVVSDNNIMSDEGESDFLFFLSPRATMSEGLALNQSGSELAESQPRELLMDLNPWTYQVAAKELRRESKTEKRANPQTSDVSDLRNYVFVAYCAELLNEDKKEYHGYYISNSIETIQFAVGFNADTNWYTNDHRKKIKKIDRDGWARTTIEVPEEKKLQDIEKLKITIIPSRKKFSLTLTDISTVFMLGKDYLPQKSIFSWQGNLILDQNNPSKIWHVH